MAAAARCESGCEMRGLQASLLAAAIYDERGRKN